MNGEPPGSGADLFVTGIGTLVTNDPDFPGLLGRIEEAAVVIRDGRVGWIGSRYDPPPGSAALPVLDCEGRAVIPGLVDPHTHAVFAGDRAAEFARRLRGESYEDILAGGGGIRFTVRATRLAGVDRLVAESAPRLQRMLIHGTTTAEVKSGYGLDVDTERSMLEAIARLDADLPIDLVPTYLGAHVVPDEYADDREGYLRLIEEEALPACAPLARFCDVFCDRGAFTLDEARRVLEAGTGHGLRPRLHAEQLTATGAAGLAAGLHAASADHLDHVSRDDAAALREAGTVAVLLPAVTLSMQTAPPPVAVLREERVVVALATDCNPGTAYVESMQFVIALACLELGISPEEAVWSATRGGALALDLPDRGRLRPGSVGDLVVLDAASPVYLPYQPGTNLAWRVVKGGAVVAGEGRLLVQSPQ